MNKQQPIILQNRAAACLLAILCTLLWGTAFPFIKLGYAAFEVAEGDVGAKLLFAGLRFFIAGAMVLAFLCVRERRFVPPGKFDAKAIAWLGLFQTFGQYLFTYIGIGFTTGANTSIITACASFLTVIGAAAFFRKTDRMTALKAAGCALGFGGVLVMNSGAGFALETLFGDVFIFLSTVFAAAGNLIAKKITPGRSPVKITAYQLLFGGAGLSAAGLLCGGKLHFNGSGVLILLWLAFVSAAAFTVWTALLKFHPASKISVFNLLVPVFGTVLSGLLLGENIFRPEILLSLACIAAGIVLVNLSRTGDKRGKSN